MGRGRKDTEHPGGNKMKIDQTDNEAYNKEMFNTIVEDVRELVSRDAAWAQEFFMGLYAGDSLIRFHHTLGREIRNKYRLWEPDMREGIGNIHPDDYSMMVIEEVWKRGYKE